MIGRSGLYCCCLSAVGWAGAAAPLAASEIDADELVVFYPTSARYDGLGRCWLLPIHGWIFEPEEDSKVKEVAVDAMKSLLRLEPRPDEELRFRQRAWPFVVESRRNEELSVELGGRVYALQPSAANGHFHGTIRLPVDDAERLLEAQALGRWLEYRAVTAPADQRVFSGRIQLVAPRGLSVVSDIDDTIKITEVHDRRAVLRNTFLRPFEPVAGMADVYQDWAEADMAFHYVSASPWQLYVCLEQFRLDSQFPSGSFDLQLFRWTDRSALNVFSDPDGLKRPAIEALIEAYPGRRFLCVGDSGQRDPEMYGELARKYPRQIARICIRNVTGERADGERFRRAFAGLDDAQWQVFQRPIELERFELPSPDGDE